MLEFISQALDLAGKSAMIFVALALWKLDRRVVRVETVVFPHRKGAR